MSKFAFILPARADRDFVRYFTLDDSSDINQQVAEVLKCKPSSVKACSKDSILVGKYLNTDMVNYLNDNNLELYVAYDSCSDKLIEPDETMISSWFETNVSDNVVELKAYEPTLVDIILALKDTDMVFTSKIKNSSSGMAIRGLYHTLSSEDIIVRWKYYDCIQYLSDAFTEYDTSTLKQYFTLEEYKKFRSLYKRSILENYDPQILIETLSDHMKTLLYKEPNNNNS